MKGEARFAVAERALFERSENIPFSVTRERAEGFWLVGTPSAEVVSSQVVPRASG